MSGYTRDECEALANIVRGSERDTAQPFAIPNKETRTEASVNWSNAFCPVCQPIVDGHFRPREAYLLAHAERLAEALKDILADSRSLEIRHYAETMLAAWEGVK